MKKLIVTILFVLYMSIVSFGQIINNSFYSTSLGKTKSVNIFLPPGYDENPNLYYPVIFFLHGWGSSNSSANSIMSEAESLINLGTIEPVIIICANNSTDPYLGSFFVNSIVSGDYEDYNINDLINWLENTYRVVPEKNYRTLMGQSMGGYGCFRYGILHKDLFRGFAAHGSSINHYLSINEITQDVLDTNPPGPPYSFDFYNTDILTKMIFAMSAAFSPNLSSPQTYINPQNVEFPLDEQGQLIDSVYQKWVVFDPVSYLDTLQPEDSVAILFGAGANDEWHLYDPNVAMQNSLDQAGLDFEFYDHNGSHGMPVGFRDRALIFLDSIMPPPKDLTCYDPSELLADNITQTTADLSWTENGDATQWQIRLDTLGFDTTGMPPVILDNDTITVDTLSPGTSYEWYIRAYCDSGQVSNWMGPDTFFVPATNSILFFEDWEYESGSRKTDGLIYLANNYEWSFNTNSQNEGRVSWGENAYMAYSGNGALTLDRSSLGSTTVNYAILTFDLSGYTASSELEFSFWWADHRDDEHPNDKVWIRGSDTNIWVEIYDIDPKLYANDVYNFVSELDIDFTLSNLTPPQTVSETFQVRFGQEGKFDVPKDGISFDDIMIEDFSLANNCIEPSNQSVINIASTTAVLSWTENGDATSWQMRFGKAGFDTVGMTPAMIANDTITVDTLLPSTSYEWYIRAYCGEGDSSAWAGPNLFNTACGTPLDLQAYDITDTSATLTWMETGVALQWQIRLDTLGFDTTAMAPVMLDNDRISVDTLLPSTSYDWYIMADCGNGQSSNWIGPHSFVTNFTPMSYSLPFNEDWEANSGILQHNGNISFDPSYQWDFETDHPGEGRVEWGTDAFLAHNGTGAMTMDRYPIGDYTINHSTLTLNLSDYVDSTGLELSFWWTDHGDENHPNDKVSIRGSDSDPWIDIYIFIPENAANNVFELVSGLDLDAALTAASQSVSETFQLRFSQEDNGNNEWDGISIDDITIQNNTPLDVFIPVTLPFTESWEFNNGSSQINQPIYFNDTLLWSFETDHPGEGRVEWGTDAFLAHNGTGAMTMDRYPIGDYTINHSTLTLNLSDYVDSTGLELSFWWTDHGDENHPNDKVSIRGSDSDPWIDIYIFIPENAANNVFELVSGLDLDAALTAASQSVSETFQLRFSQEDNGNNEWDGISIDDITIQNNTPLDVFIPVTLPFTESWEFNNGSSQINQPIYFSDTLMWSFETDHPGEGRVEWGTDAFLAHNGTGAMTMDRYPIGDYTINHSTLTLNLSDYVDSTGLELSFWWTDHGDENHPNDKVSIRGSDSDPWIDIYIFIPENAANNVFELVSGLDLDAALTAASQSVSETFQLRFSQEDNGNNEWDGITIDDIMIEEIQTSAKVSQVSIFEVTKDYSEIKVYTKKGFIFIKSSGNLSELQKEVRIYDMFGRMINNSTLPPASLNKIAVESCSCYHIVKVVCNDDVSTFKVFVK